MSIPLILLKHVAKACLNGLTGGIAGDLVFGIADDVMKNWQKESDERARRAELEDLARATTGEVKVAVADVVSLVAADRPEQERRDLSAYLMQVPASIRRTLRRPTDPSGRTVPEGFAVRTAHDLVSLLPSRLPRFQPGDHPMAGVDRELVELLGVGGFEEVWKAVNPNRPGAPPVALKFCLDDAARDRLLRHEANLLDRIMRMGAHPGIVALRDTYLNADPPCLEYEFVGGGELTGLILDFHRSRGGVSPRGTAKIVERLARTVGDFHRLDPPIVHRDLKPANILVTTDDQGRLGVKIADFGIGGVAADREIERERTHRSRDEPLCSVAHGSFTPLYASPEQVRGAPPDPRDDVHALGVIWHQILTGDLSHGAPTGLDWADDLAARGMTREQVEVIASCFSSRRERRPADAGVLAERIGSSFQLREKRTGVTASGGVPPAQRPRFTVRGVLERFGKDQWNVLVSNVDEMVRFWDRHKVTTRLDWAGMSPPKATVGRKSLVAKCDAAGEGARVEYDVEVQDRSNGPGIKGVDVRVVAPPHPGGENGLRDTPQATVPQRGLRSPEEGLSFDEVVARLKTEGGRPGKTATPEGSYYPTVRSLRFVPCQCSRDDPSYGHREYIARTPRGTCYYISLNLKTRLITCGPKGYHYCRPNVPECI